MPSFSKSPPQIKIPSVKVLQEGDRMNTTQHPIAGVLSDVPEESTLRTPRSAVPNSPYFSPTHHQAAASTSTFRASSPPAANGTSTQPLPSASASVSQKPSEGVDRDGSNGSMKQALTPSKSSGSLAAPKEIKKSSTEHPTKPRVRALPRLPHSKDVELAPTTTMYWSKGPVYGHMPSRGMRAHSATLVDNVVWLFGGCDEKGCWKDVYCFDTGAFIPLYQHFCAEFYPQKLCNGPTRR
jgi:Rab9 effector protein with kelch motifs